MTNMNIITRVMTNMIIITSDDRYDYYYTSDDGYDYYTSNNDIERKIYIIFMHLRKTFKDSFENLICKNTMEANNRELCNKG